MTFLDGTTHTMDFKERRTTCAGRAIELIDADGDTLVINVAALQTLHCVALGRDAG